MQFAAPIDGMSDFLDDEEGTPRNPGTLLDLMCVEVANLLADAKHSSSPEPRADKTKRTDSPFNLLVQAQTLDAKLSSWPTFVPIDWVPIQVSAERIPKSVIETSLYGESCDIYPDIMVCSTWNEWRTARLMVLGLITRFGHKESREQAILRIQELVDGICASVPFVLGDRTEPGNVYGAQINYPTPSDKPRSMEHQQTATAYGGWSLFAPFKETMNIRMYLRKGQYEWLSRQLLRLAKMYGVTPALSRS